MKKTELSLLENELKVGDKVIYNGLYKDREGVIIKRTVRTITIKMEFSTIKILLDKKNCHAIDLGLRRLSHEQ